MLLYHGTGGIISSSSQAVTMSAVFCKEDIILGSVSTKTNKQHLRTAASLTVWGGQHTNDYDAIQ